MGWTGINSNRSFEQVFEEEYNESIRSNKIIKYAEVVKTNKSSVFYIAARRANGAIGANVILFERERGEVLYKEMDEGMGPHGYDCPADILQLLSPIKDLEYPGYSEDWRKAQKHAPKLTPQINLF
jgi:hypothetical protein